MKLNTLKASLAFIALLAIGVDSQSSSVWTYLCRNNADCQRTQRSEPGGSTGVPLDVCKLNCAPEGSLLPLPTGPISLGQSLTGFYPSKVTFRTPLEYPNELQLMITQATNIFQGYLTKMSPDGFNPITGPYINSSVTISFEISNTDTRSISIGMDESYNLTLRTPSADNVLVDIKSANYFGARHALETLSQLIAYDEDKEAFQVVNTVSINDKPVYLYRGVQLDTSRNYFSIASLKRLIDGLSFAKLNIFHWHITDTHSFPMVVENRPQMTEYGAYSPSKIYSLTDMRDLVQYATIRGVKIVPEFDEPAHTGYGWEWGPSAGLGNLAVCINKQPWYDFCVEPPCGQLNVVNDNMYTVLGDVFTSMLKIFDNDLFHMGGDEVDFRCYNTTQEITDWMTQNGYPRTEEGFVRLWGRFQAMAHEKLVAASTDKSITSIMWTSELTKKQHIGEHLDPSKYIIQIWTDSVNQEIADLINAGYRSIFSNYDVLYLDCGFQSWIGTGHNWCSPYHGWQSIYDHSPHKIYSNLTDSTSADEALADGRLLGAEAPLWTEQADEYSMESRIWPRGSALAERLWSNPPASRDWSQAESRIVTTRARYVQRGIAADRLQPEFCSMYQNNCYGYGEGTDKNSGAQGSDASTIHLPLLCNIMSTLLLGFYIF